jgi:hypothetical protein
MSEASDIDNFYRDTPVEDVRRIREQRHREAGGDVYVLAERTRRETEALIQKLGLRVVQAPPAKPIAEDLAS